MTWTLSQTDEFDEIIDVRSAAEYELDHIPGASNYPVLDDAERARVGTLYKQVSPFEARKEGAGLVASHISQHINSTFKTRDKHWRPLIYCWRGGARSRAMTQVLNSVGWQAQQLPGGYKAYRRAVIEALQDVSQRAVFKVLCGRTGVGKSRLLETLALSSEQVLDLESCANHRGSVLGEPTEGQQPSQKAFESILCTILRDFDLDKPIYVEAESRKIGRLQVPEPLITAMRASQCLDIDMDLPQRVEFLVAEYQHFVDDPQRFEEAMQRLRPFLGHAQIDEWCDRFKKGQTSAVVKELIEKHYDPFYLRAIKKHFSHYPTAAPIKLAGIQQSDFAAAAQAIVSHATQAGAGAGAKAS